MIFKSLVSRRFWYLAITIAVAAVCFVLLFHVNINTDMSKYLPNDSNMRAGLEILHDEFGDMAEMGGNDIRVMFKDLSEEEKLDNMADLRKLENVNSVIEQENGDRTLYELGVSSAIDQVALGAEISENFQKVEAVETSQDGAAAEPSMMIGGIALLLVILLIMCRSWLEPVLFLTSTGLALLINIGTNALLPSVSVTTNSIVAVLQLVLSMDYSIILLNHFRQDRAKTDDSQLAMQRAIQRAFRPILGSATTTIVGLLMLIFMKLKIGADLSIVLSKGVLCSLICNFTVLPSLILKFEKGLEKTRKKVPLPPTDNLAHFSMRCRIPLVILFIAIFVSSYILHNKTNIIYLNSKISKIEKYFPKKNPIVLVYDNADEKKIIGLLDSLMADPGVDMVISYPTLLRREYTAPQMMEALTNLSDIMGGISPDSTPPVSLSMLSVDILKTVYGLKFNGTNKELTMKFNDMADFILEQTHDPNSLITKQVDDEMKDKIKQLDDLRHNQGIYSATYEQPVKKSTPTVTNSSIPEKKSEPVVTTKPREPEVKKETPVISHVTPKQAQSSPYTDTALLNKPMTYVEMADFLNMNASQAKSVYKLAKRNGSKMTPMQFIHFVTDDILKRKALAKFIGSTERTQLLALQHTMDSAMMAAYNPPVMEPVVKSEDNSQTPEIPESTSVDNPPATHTDTIKHPKPVPIPSFHVKPSTNDPLTVLDEMLNSNKEYTAKQMCHNLEVIGEKIPCELMDLLFLYYSGIHNYDSTWTMSLEQLVNFLADTMLTDDRFSAFIDDNMQKDFGKMRLSMEDGVGKLRSDKHSIAMIITNYETESNETYDFIDHYNALCQNAFSQPYYSIGESIMLSEMRAGFDREVLLVTLLTIAAIFLIVAITFHSLLLAAILVMTVMSGVFANIVISGLGGGSILYIAYLIVQSILMGAAIDYGILFANYYRTKRVVMSIEDALTDSYRCATHTILTSGLILILVPAIMTVLVSDPTVSDILQSIAIGAAVTVLLILFVLPGVLAACDRFIVRKRFQE